MKRVNFIDTIRGILILGVVVYHTMFDLYYMFDLNIEKWFLSPFFNFIRDFGAGTFIFIAGISSRFSHNNFIRAVKVLSGALFLSLITYFFLKNDFIFIGILHFMGIAILLYALIGPLLEKLPAPVIIIVNVILFGICVPLLFDKGPESLRINTFTYILGFGGGNLDSSDYFPILPWIFLFFAGSGVGDYVKKGKIPKWTYKDYCKPVTWVGRHTIYVYLLHQPIVYGILYVIFKLVKL